MAERRGRCLTICGTRIAAALKAEAERRGIYWIADFDFPFMADAVIRELGLSSERRHPIATESGIKVGNWMIPTQSRYVTEWLDDE